MSYRLSILALLVTALYAGSAGAHEGDAPMFSFSGFGTVGVVHSSEDQADFTSNFFKPNGAGYSHSWSADVDSLIGGQVTANLTPKLAAVLQIIAEQNYDNSYRPHVEWANIKYQFTPDFSVRVGRTILSSFLFSDTRKVGYTYPWVRPPLEVYHLLPVTASDGLDVSYHLNVGELENTVQASVGRKDFKDVGGGTTEARGSWGLAYTVEYGPLSARATYQKTNLTIASINTFFNAFRQFGPQGVALADKYDSAEKPSRHLGIGVSYDPGNWFVMGEWVRAEIDSFIGNGTGWYVSGGYRFGTFTPYVTYARANADNLSDPGLAAPGAAGLNAALNSILSTKPVQNTVSIGGRWDFMKNAAFKLQYDHTRIGTGSTGTLINTQPGFQLGGEVNVFSATIDFVF